MSLGLPFMRTRAHLDPLHRGKRDILVYDERQLLAAVGNVKRSGRPGRVIIGDDILLKSSVAIETSDIEITATGGARLFAESGVAAHFVVGVAGTRIERVRFNNLAFFGVDTDTAGTLAVSGIGSCYDLWIDRCAVRCDTIFDNNTVANFTAYARIRIKDNTIDASLASTSLYAYIKSPLCIFADNDMTGSGTGIVLDGVAYGRVRHNYFGGTDIDLRGLSGNTDIDGNAMGGGNIFTSGQGAYKLRIRGNDMGGGDITTNVGTLVTGSNIIEGNLEVGTLTPEVTDTVGLNT